MACGQLAEARFPEALLIIPSPSSGGSTLDRSHIWKECIDRVKNKIQWVYQENSALLTNTGVIGDCGRSDR